MSKKLNIGILIFDEAEVLDFAGPFEVFAVCSELQNHKLFNVFTVAKKTSSINARKIKCDFWVVNGITGQGVTNIHDSPSRVDVIQTIQ